MALIQGCFLGNSVVEKAKMKAISWERLENRPEQQQSHETTWLGVVSTNVCSQEIRVQIPGCLLLSEADFSGKMGGFKQKGTLQLLSRRSHLINYLNLRQWNTRSVTQIFELPRPKKMAKKKKSVELLNVGQTISCRFNVC